MHTLRFVVLTLSALALACSHLRAQSADPADEYFRAYLMNNEAERLVQSHDMQRALDKYQQAQTIFDSIAQNNPTWQSDMLSFRRHRLASAISDVQAKIAAAANTPAAPPPAPPSIATPAPAPTSVPNAVPMPSGQAPPPAAPSTGDPVRDAVQQLLQATDAKAAAVQQQLTEALANVGRYQLGYEQMVRLKDQAVQQRDEFYLKADALAKNLSSQEAKIAQLEAAVKTGGATKAELDKARKDLEDAKEELADIKSRAAKAEQTVMTQGQKLAEASLKLASVEKERDTLKQQFTVLQTENDTLKKRVVPDNMKELMAENERLKKDLEATRKQVTTLTSDLAKRDAEIGELKGQLNSIQGELFKLRKENAAYEAQVADLTVELKKIKDRAADPSKGKPDEVPQLMAENQLLKGIVMRQLRLQARQQEQKKLVIAEIQKTENASKDLIDQVEQLAGDRVMLTPEEQKLFTTPQLQEIMGADGIKGTIIVQADNASDKPKPPSDDEAAKKQKAIDELIDKGNKQLDAGKLAEAEASYQDVLRADPKNATGLAGLAWTRVQQGKLDDAEATLKKSLAYDANNSAAHYMLAVTYFRRDKFTEAMASFEKSLSINPKQARARHYLGVISSKLGVTERAEREFKNALAIDPGYGDADFNLAVLYATSKPPKFDEARKHYDEAIKKGVKADPNLEKLLKPKADAASAKAKPE